MDITKKIDNYIITENKTYIKIVSRKIQDIDWNKIKVIIKKNINIFADFVEKAGIEKEALQIINKNLKTNFKSIRDITNLKLLESPVFGYSMNDISKQWDKIKCCVYSLLSKFKFNDAFVELSELMVENGHKSPSAVVFYVLFWSLLSTGKLINKMK